MTKDEDWIERSKALTDQPTPVIVESCLGIARAKPADDADTWNVYRHLIGKMHERGGPTEFEAGRTLLTRADSIERELGCDILGQLGWGTTFAEESVELLIASLSDEVEDVVAAALTALGHRGNARTIEPALALVDHPNEKVRLGSVMALSGHEDRRATDALIELSRDDDHDVRNWATFGIGRMCAADYPDLREALRERVAEQDSEIRSEAMEGLASRKDEGVLPVIMAALESGDVIAGYLDAARAAADPVLLPALLKLHGSLAPGDEGYWVACLEHAIVACTPATSFAREPRK